MFLLTIINWHKSVYYANWKFLIVRNVHLLMVLIVSYVMLLHKQLFFKESVCLVQLELSFNHQQNLVWTVQIIAKDAATQ
jgi:hypothetical protein